MLNKDVALLYVRGETSQIRDNLMEGINRDYFSKAQKFIQRIESLKKSQHLTQKVSWA